jgi:hypothetical protein
MSAAPARAQTAAEVQITPETMTLGVGQRQTLFATAYDRQGNLIPNARFTFYSSDTLIAKVTREGAVLGVSPGLAKVEARVQGRRRQLHTAPVASDTTAERPRRQVPCSRRPASPRAAGRERDPECPGTARTPPGCPAG